MTSIVSVEQVQQRIFFIRGQRVMIDTDLAALYGVETRALLQAVRRNSERFPPDFTFQLSGKEFEDLRSQLVISNSARGGRRYRPYVFTEQGVAMLSSVLKSLRAVHVNIEVMRAFVRLRQMVASHKDLRRRLDELERKYDAQFKIVFVAIQQLMTSPEKPKSRIGFHP